MRPLRVNDVIMNNFAVAQGLTYFNILDIDDLYRLRIAEFMYKTVHFCSLLSHDIMNDLRWRHGYDTKDYIDYILAELMLIIFFNNPIKV